MLPVVLIIVVPALSLAPRLASAPRAARCRSPLMLGAPAAAAAFASTQGATLAFIVQELGLHPSDEFNLQPGVSVRSYVNQGKLVHEGLEASRARAEAADNAAASQKMPVSWLSSLSVSGADDCLFTLTAWNLPVVDVPHLYTSVGVSGGAIELCIDFRPRAEAGYLSRLPDGSYPEPASRDMFMEASTRKDLADRYFTEDAEAWRAAVLSTAGAQPLPPFCAPPESAGPLMLSLTLPLSEAGVHAAREACVVAASSWVGWVVAAEQLDQRRTMTTFAVDAKVRAVCSAATTQALQARYGPEAGAELAQLDAGRRDLADRSSSMNNAATSNFDASEADQSALDMQQLVADGVLDAEKLGGYQSQSGL